MTTEQIIELLTKACQDHIDKGGKIIRGTSVHSATNGRCPLACLLPEAINLSLGGIHIIAKMLDRSSDWIDEFITEFDSSFALDPDDEIDNLIGHLRSTFQIEMVPLE